jgi:hypothetical protein
VPRGQGISSALKGPHVRGDYFVTTALKGSMNVKLHCLKIVGENRFDLLMLLNLLDLDPCLEYDLLCSHGQRTPDMDMILGHKLAQELELSLSKLFVSFLAVKTSNSSKKI